MNWHQNKQINKNFYENLLFLREAFRRPQKIGAVIPTSSITARRMVSLVNINSDLPVLELGAGTGVVTRALLKRGLAPHKIVSIEYVKEFYNYLKVTFPGISFVHGDVFDLEKTLSKFPGIKFDSVISGLPLLNFPLESRINLIKNLLNLIPPGRPIVQICYGINPPVKEDPEEYILEHYDFIIRNIPPARIWIFKKILTS
ncbi:Phosphatidylethanolamine N-methyltransferase [Liberibacter crescens BT-1]|uniref:Phosphatidylethanolamine N-methyltransferase n=1 Tax=Liberibacter crescens (strain BT-1) TaxID=1215343 RepID=L0ETY6_LIBCB|nr:methyltransferase domain-containing protein [Liberibacter crescens]AGA64108.1 Phosphatidylethanolamine N-methyltransferase [Liberibacter crescens BT-1]AMC12389.1 SAM-dependent methlyltransferase [Liberibacter crescens]